MSWTPRPIDTSDVTLDATILHLVERLSENAHDNWGLLRMKAGWRYGDERNDEAKTHPLLVPYADLSEEEKDYDRNLVVQTIKTMIGLGYRIIPPPAG